MEGADAAEGGEGEVVWVVPACDGDAAQGGFHVGVGDAQDGGRSFVWVALEGALRAGALSHRKA